VKNKSLVLAAAALSLSIFLILSCKKVNEATDLGGGLIPSVDNVNTFELSLPTETDNLSLLNDTTRVLYQDQSALGYLADPEFGNTEANIYFSISSKTYTTHPFINKDQLVIDSVVLSLGYKGAYGDTNSTQTVSVYEIDPSVKLSDSLSRYAGNNLPVTGSPLGTKSFSVTTLKDTITLIKKKDTTKVANVLRIRLNNSLGSKLAAFDTINGVNGGYYNDSIFQTLFKGLAVKTGTSGNVLSYYDIFDDTKTNLTVYFRATKNSIIDTNTASFYHAPVYSSATGAAFGLANPVIRTPANNWLTYLNNATTTDDKLYIQSSPGSYGTIKIPGLDNMTNRVIHLAELIVYRVPSALDNILILPPALYLDRLNATKDTAFIFEGQSVNPNNSLASYIGGIIKDDNSYRFNITRHVQAIVTRKQPNTLLRLYAPLRAALSVQGFTTKAFGVALDKIANGRVVVAGGNYSDPNLRLKLRVVYSNL